jgi:DNA-binding protein YbaB
MGFFDKAKDIYNLRKQAKDIKKKLKNIHIEAETKGIVVTINAEMEVISIVIPPDLTDNQVIAESVKDAMNKAMKKAQIVAAENMKEIMGEMGMGMPGM